jgi:hypothetical protein
LAPEFRIKRIDALGRGRFSAHFLLEVMESKNQKNVISSAALQQRGRDATQNAVKLVNGFFWHRTSSSDRRRSMAARRRDVVLQRRFFLSLHQHVSRVSAYYF